MFPDGRHHLCRVAFVMPLGMVVFGTPDNDIGMVGEWRSPRFSGIIDAKQLEIVIVGGEAVAFVDDIFVLAGGILKHPGQEKHGGSP